MKTKWDYLPTFRFRVSEAYLEGMKTPSVAVLIAPRDCRSEAYLEGMKTFFRQVQDFMHP